MKPCAGVKLNVGTLRAPRLWARAFLVFLLRPFSSSSRQTAALFEAFGALGTLGAPGEFVAPPI